MLEWRAWRNVRCEMENAALVNSGLRDARSEAVCCILCDQGICVPVMKCDNMVQLPFR